jgi:hypothetical protein
VRCARACWPLAVGTGLQVMAAIMEADVVGRAGPGGRHDPERTATRHGHARVGEPGRAPGAVDGSGELPVPAYGLFSDTAVLGRMALRRMLAGLSTRCYDVGLETQLGNRDAFAQPRRRAWPAARAASRPARRRRAAVRRTGPVMGSERGLGSDTAGLS